MAAGSHIGFDLRNVRSPTKCNCIAGLSLILKFGIDPIYSFGGIAIFIFCRFGLKLSIQAHFGVWGIESQIWSLVTHRSEPQEGPSLRGSTSFEP